MTANPPPARTVRVGDRPIVIPDSLRRALTLGIEPRRNGRDIDSAIRPIGLTQLMTQRSDLLGRVEVCTAPLDRAISMKRAIGNVLGSPCKALPFNLRNSPLSRPCPTDQGLHQAFDAMVDDGGFEFALHGAILWLFPIPIGSGAYRSQSFETAIIRRK